MAHVKTKSFIDVVVIGGGTGNSTVLAGLKPIVRDGLTAIVNTFDDGGGTGRLRDEYEGLPAVGDIRQCIRALSNSSEDISTLLDYRFQEGSSNSLLGLHGQTLGNLILAAASQRNNNFAEALGIFSRMYDITGKVVPASDDSRRLRVIAPNGQIIEGEHNIEIVEIPSFKGAKVGFDKEPTKISLEAKEAIKNADMVVLAPGDLYTSTAPNLVVEGMKEALEATNAVVMVANLMNRRRHTAGFDVLDYVEEYERLIGAKVIKSVLFNCQPLDKDALREQDERYGSRPVSVNIEALTDRGYSPVGRKLLGNSLAALDPADSLEEIRSTIFHDPLKVANALLGIYYSQFADKDN